MKAISNIIGLHTFTASQFVVLQQTFLFQKQTKGTFNGSGRVRQAAFKDFEDLAGRTGV